MEEDAEDEVNGMRGGGGRVRREGWRKRGGESVGGGEIDMFWRIEMRETLGGR